MNCWGGEIVIEGYEDRVENKVANALTTGMIPDASPGKPIKGF
jgi:hypothetical protein